MLFQGVLGFGDIKRRIASEEHAEAATRREMMVSG